MPIDIIQKLDIDKWYKFRAWDILNKVMHYDVEYMTVKNKEGDILGVVFQSDIQEHNFEQWPPENDYESKLIFMDYIKVKDMDGKKIYYLDLVQVTNNGEEWVGAVNYNKGGCPYAYDVESGSGTPLHSCYFDNKDATFKVVGNVYETPELCPKIVKYLIEKTT